MVKITKKKIREMMIQVLLIMLGTLLMSFGYIVFLAHNNIVPGGFMGLAKIIHDLLGKIGFDLISVSAWYIVLNVFLYIYSVKVLGIEFGIRTGVGIFSYSLFTSLFEKLPIIDSINQKFIEESSTLGGGAYILFAIYGGLIMGIGIGLVFRGNGSTGGSDVVAVVVNRFFPMITTGQIIIIVDGIVVFASLIAYNSILLPLYALITIFVSGKVSDVFVNGVKSLQAYYILTDKKEEIASKIMTDIKRGVTNIRCEGMYTRKQKEMLLVILRRSQIMQLKKIVKEIDPNSFMFSHSVKDIRGLGFVETNNKNKDNKKTQNSENLEQKTDNLSQNKENNEILENNNNINNSEI